jgi:hypothetical protein
MIMFPCVQCNDCVSPEYREFTEEYHNFLKYSIQFSHLDVAIKALKVDNIQVLTLRQQALEAHIAATRAYIQLTLIYIRLVQKYWDSI